MKRRLPLYLVLFLLLTTLLISCSGLEREKDTLKLDKTSMTINQEGGNEYLTFISNGPWQVQDVPDWISMDRTSGDYSDGITLEVAENPENGRRKASLLFIRGKASEALEVEQLGLDEVAPFIELDTYMLNSSSLVSSFRVKLTTNRPWKLYFAPDWITVTPSSGDQSTEITVSIAENRNLEGRESVVVFQGESENKPLKISQQGLGDMVISPGLFIFRFERMRYDSKLNQLEGWANYLFINPSIQDDIYLGNLVCPAAQSNTYIPGFSGYTYNPITVSTSSPAVSEVMKTYLPSLSEQDAFARQIAEQITNGEGGAIIESLKGSSFYNHKQLHVIGMINLGVKLDELVSGASYMEKDMPRKYGLIYSFKRTFFSLDMDIPEKLIQEELKEADREKGAAYVSSVTYGRVGLLIVESDADPGEVQAVIDKLMGNKPLSQQETELLSVTDIYYVYFDKDKNVQIEKGGQEVVTAYKEAIRIGTDGIYPVEFSLANYMDNSPYTFSFVYMPGK